MAQESALLSAPEARPPVAAGGAKGQADDSQGVRGGWIQRLAMRLVRRRLDRLADGRLTVVENGRRDVFGQRGETDLDGTVMVQDPAFWERIAWGGSIGAAEAFCDGFWSTPDLTTVVRIFARNQEALQDMDSGIGTLGMPLRRLLHRVRTNSRAGSIRNISAHYDRGNEFFATFLDSSLTYSCAVFPDELATLETAQQCKLDTICRKLELSPEDHLLEIGSGWGSLAMHAASNYGCRVTTATISSQQFSYVSRAVAEAGLEDRVRILDSDYRDLPSRLGRRFDKLVSIEMIEAVGHRYLPVYFEVIGRLLEPQGRALLQAITIPDQRYENYRRSVDFIQQYIFPGGLLPSLARIKRCVKERSDLQLLGLEHLTPHYATTLAAWRRRFRAREREIAAHGLSAAERRKWLYYFGYCEGAFLERAIGNVQLLFGRPRSPMGIPLEGVT